MSAASTRIWISRRLTGSRGGWRGVPAVLIVDPKTNKLINAGRETALADARSMTPQAVADWWPVGGVSRVV